MPFDLNAEQREAVRECARPVLVLAGAGSGKTRLIAAKIAHLVEQGVPAERILALTFTRKAAREMAERLGAVLGERAQGVRTCTFHAFGLALLAERPEAFGLRPGFSLLDAEDARRLLGEVTGAQGAALATLAAAVSWQRQRGLAPEEALAVLPAEELEAARAHARYAARLRALNAIDFDDLILRPLFACRADTALGKRLQARFEHLLVDEWQDTNLAQYLLFRALVGDGKPFTVVGDDDQSIYAWRGAHPENLRLLAADFPALRVVKLERNYRSTEAILRAANALIARNPHLFAKRLHSVGPQGDPPLSWCCRTAEEEGERVALDIRRRCELEGRRPADFAVLYRSNHQSRALEEALRLQRIPYRLSGGTSFFEHREIRDLIAYLRLVSNPGDDVAFLRAVANPRRTVGEATLERLAALGAGDGLYAGARRLIEERGEARSRGLADFVAAVERWRVLAASAPLAELARAVLRESGLEAALLAERDPERAARRRHRLQQFLAFLERRGLRGAAGLIEIVLLAREEEDAPGDAVLLSTIHAAKGLEFPVVYVVGLEEGLLPHDQALADGQVEEERRLLYVAITRARERLILSRAEARRAGGGWKPSAPSRFLAEIPSELLDAGERDPAAADAEAAWHRQRIRALLAAAPSS